MTAHNPGLRKMADLHQRIIELRQQMTDLMKATPQEVQDYTFKTIDGDVSLSSLFGGKPDLLMVHNMGTGCTGCTLWADGFNGIYPHLANRAAFCISSPDTPETQQEFAASRGWRFPMVSHQGSSFAEDMGYRGEDGSWHPGLSSFRIDNAKITRIATTPMGPFDDYCPVWHMFNLLQDGPDGWQPQYKYD
jgi:predicted dithiol-disulfide oxidoreductase (DUF899 family)